MSRRIGTVPLPLNNILDKFYREYDFQGRMRYDPIEFPHRYKRPEDIETVAFISSCFAYGKVELFKPVIEKVLALIGTSPHSFLLDFDVRKRKRLFTFKYRFNENEDILCLVFLLHKILRRSSSLGNAFRKYFKPDDPDTGSAITGLIRELLSFDTTVVYGKDLRPRGLTQMLPSPEGGSACKRINLFLRWMVRDRDIDFGLWKGVPKNKLVIPLDTHIARISRCIGFTRRKTSDWRTAVEITEALKRLDPEDPLKYDFALCHQGISGLCKAGDETACEECALNCR